MNKDDKVGVAVGITDKLTNKFDAVKFVKLSFEIEEMSLWCGFQW